MSRPMSSDEHREAMLDPDSDYFDPEMYERFKHLSPKYQDLIDQDDDDDWEETTGIDPQGGH